MSPPAGVEHENDFLVHVYGDKLLFMQQRGQIFALKELCYLTLPRRYRHLYTRKGCAD